VVRVRQEAIALIFSKIIGAFGLGRTEVHPHET